MTVVDISQQLPGPYASAMLAALGASVTKVEPPRGDPSSWLDPAMYALVNAGKEIRHLDLKTAEGTSELHRLVGDADVFIEGFRPGVVDRLGASWATLNALKPSLVYCSISAVGQRGPYRRVPMHDLNLQGLASLDPGAGIGVPWVDLGTGAAAALAIVAAWLEARETGEGVRLDSAMLDTAVLWARVKEVAHGREEPTYGTFLTADGARVALAILEDHIWLRLCDAFTWNDWRDQPSFMRYDDRVERAALIRSRVESACLGRTVDELLDLAALHDLPLTPVGAPPGSAAADQLAERRLLGPASRRVPLPERSGEGSADDASGTDEEEAS
jgi:crotonobetainyl-CoA:carnitine CoA-transferase CaiB-like acyl-CoA transferase